MRIHHVRIDALRSAVEAAGVAMAPSADQFDGEAGSFVVDVARAPAISEHRTVTMDAGNYSRSWARPVYREGFARPEPQPTLFQLWFGGKRARIVST